MSYDVVDDFCGVGWGVACEQLGLAELGYDAEPNVIATRAAAGMPAVLSDIAARDPHACPPARGYIASPPCPTFSAAGSGGGRMLTAILAACMSELASGTDMRADARDSSQAVLTPIYVSAAIDKGKDTDNARRRAREDAEMSVLIVEPLRYVLARRPEWVACEQVPACLELWRHMGGLLERIGYRWWAGLLSAEQFGDPQTRERAIFIARLESPVHPPAPTHRAYVKGEPADGGEMSLFGDDLLPWISMEQALGWGSADLVGFPRLNDTPSNKPAEGDEGKYRERDFRRGAEPAFGMTEKIRSTVRMRGTNQPNATERSIDEPAPTIASGHSTADRVWIQTTNFTAKSRDLDGQRSKNGSEPYERDVDAPAPTIDGQVGSWKVKTSRDSGEQERNGDEPAPTVSGADAQWTRERPATTVQGDPRVWPPGHKINQEDIEAGRTGKDRAGTEAIRVSVEEAAALQSFPPGFPWQGTQTQRFKIIGNAVPVCMARAIIVAAAGLVKCAGCGRTVQPYDGGDACERCVMASFAEHG